jgi:hypothetical protein
VYIFKVVNTLCNLFTNSYLMSIYHIIYAISPPFFIVRTILKRRKISFTERITKITLNRICLIHRVKHILINKQYAELHQ